MKWLVKLILVSSLMSCSAQWHLKRAVKKDPTILEKDTLVVTDTVVVPPVVTTDTVITKQQDTIVVEKERLKVKVIRNVDTLIIDAKCDSDTIVKQIEVPFEKFVYVEQKTFFQKIQGLVFYFALIVLALIIGKRLIDKYLFNE
jgi:hypothetical protein